MNYNIMDCSNKSCYYYYFQPRSSTKVIQAKLHFMYTRLEILCNALHCPLTEHRAAVGICIEQKAQAVTDINLFAEELFTEVTSAWKLQHVGRLECVQHRVTGDW